MSMTIQAMWPAIIAAIAALSGIYLGWSARAREIAGSYKKDGENHAKLQMDVDYIKRGVDELGLNARDQARQMTDLSERVTRAEESGKQAHKRLDTMERKIMD